MAVRRSRRVTLILLIVLAICLVPLAGAALFAATFDPNRVKPAIEAAVKRATGRDLALNGPIGIKLAIRPTLEARDVVFANLPGGSRPAMATVGRLQAQIALLPLLRHRLEIDRLVIIRPDILLETDAEGRGNWQFSPEAKSPSSTDKPAGTPAQPLGVAIRDVRIEDGVLTYRNGRTGSVTALTLREMQATAAAFDAPVQLAMQASYADAPFTVTGETGSLARLEQPGAGEPWPLRLRLAASGATLDVDGRVADPLRLRGVGAKLAAQIPDLAHLGALFGLGRLPALHDVRVATEIADGNGPSPEPTALTAHTGASDLSAIRTGLTLAALDLTAPSLDQPITVAAQGALGAAPVKVAGTTGPLRGLVSNSTVENYPFDLTLNVADQTLSARGALSDQHRPSLRADLAAPRIDVDALVGTLGTPAPVNTPMAATGQPATPAPAPAANDRVFSDRVLPFAQLRAADADLHVTVASLGVRGTDLHNVAGHLALADGRLALDPLTAQLPAGSLQARLGIDASQPEPPVSVVVKAPGMPLTQLLALLRVPADASGALEIDADLRGIGQTPHALAASADGHLGLAMVNGEVDNRLLEATLGQVLRRARLPDITARAGQLPVRCLAFRVDMQHGKGDVRALLLDTSLAYLEGGGTLDLAGETLALRLHPLARLGGTGVVVPLRINGPFRAPKVEVDAAASAAEAAQLGAQASRSPQLGIIIGALGGDRMLSGGSPDDCPRDLALARGGATGPLPTAAAEQPKAPKPADLLRQFLR